MLKKFPLWLVVVLAWLAAVSGDDFWKFNVMELFATVAIVVTATVAIVKLCRYVKQKRVDNQLKGDLDVLIKDGIRIKARITSSSEERYDISDAAISKWNTTIDNLLQNTKWSSLWGDKISSLPEMEPEQGLSGLEQYADIDRKNMSNCLSRLKEIRDRLGY